MMSLMFIVGFFGLLLLPLTYIIILISSLQPHHISSATSVRTHLAASEKKEEGRNGVVAGLRYTGPQKEECRVCLSEVEEGEEIGELRCHHVFHKVCLDAWVGTGHATCPLCRDRVFAPAVGDDDGGSYVVMLRLCSLMSSRRAGRDDGSWWLR